MNHTSSRSRILLTPYLPDHHGHGEQMVENSALELTGGLNQHTTEVKVDSTPINAYDIKVEKHLLLVLFAFLVCFL